MSALVRQHLSSAAGAQDGKVGGGGGGGGVRGRIAVEFYEKKRRRSNMWFGGLAKGEEEVCWEIWTLDVTIATPRTESGKFLTSLRCTHGPWKGCEPRYTQFSYTVSS